MENIFNWFYFGLELIAGLGLILISTKWFLLQHPPTTLDRLFYMCLWAVIVSHGVSWSVDSVKHIETE